MRYLVDIVHPAHVHFYRHMISALHDAGHKTRVVARKKDVTGELLDLYGIAYTSVGEAGGGSRWAQGAELVRRDIQLLRIARSFRPDAVLTRNPSGVQAAKLVSGCRGIFDTDDGRQAGIHYRAAAPFADVITTPDCLPDDLGPKQLRYPSYKVLAYLHPDHFIPDPSVRNLLGVEADEPYFLVRFVSMTASHDRSEAGLDLATKRLIIDRLSERGRVFVSSESALPSEWEHLRFSVPPHRMHDALAGASLVVGDSHTVSAEAAVLGVPSIRVSTFSGRLAPQEEMEHVYGLTFSYTPDQAAVVLDRIDRILDDEPPEQWQERRRRLLDDKVDLVTWYLELLERLAEPVGA